MSLVLLADDHDLILEGLRDLIKHRFKGLEVILASNLQEQKEILNKRDVDLLVQDVKFGDADAREFIQSITADHPDMRILVLSSIDIQETIAFFMRYCQGYVIKSDPVEDILHGIRSVLNNENYLSPSAKKIHNRILLSDNEDLTKRELDVLRALYEEQTIVQTAEKLSLSVKTIEMYRTRLFEKLQVTNAIGALKKTISKDLLGK